MGFTCTGNTVVTFGSMQLPNSTLFELLPHSSAVSPAQFSHILADPCFADRVSHTTPRVLLNRERVGESHEAGLIERLLGLSSGL